MVTATNTVPDLSGKVIFITGGTAGIGRATVLALAAYNPSHIYFTGRSQPSATSLLSTLSSLHPSVDATFLQCDLTSLKSIREALKGFTQSRLDIFIANAGIMAVDPALTEDGVEIQFGVNHLGNAALLMGVLPTMLKTAALPGADVRYVSLTSLGYQFHPKNGVDFDTLATTQEHFMTGTWGRYGQSKLANIVFAHELTRRHPDITSVVVHPGVIATGLISNLSFWRRMFVHVTSFNQGSVEDGCLNSVWAATAQDVKREGVALYEPVGKEHKGDAACFDEELGKKLWEWTEKML